MLCAKNRQPHGELATGAESLLETFKGGSDKPYFSASSLGLTKGHSKLQARAPLDTCKRHLDSKHIAECKQLSDL